MTPHTGGVPTLLLHSIIIIQTMFQETKEGETHFCCEKCRKCPDYGDNHSEFCHDKKCRCHVPAEKWEEEFDRNFKYVFSEKDPIYGAENTQNKNAIKIFISHAISEAVKEERERAEAEKNDCPGCIDC